MYYIQFQLSTVAEQILFVIMLVFPVNRDTGTADRMRRAGYKVINPSTAAVVGNLAPTHQLRSCVTLSPVSVLY